MYSAAWFGGLPGGFVKRKEDTCIWAVRLGELEIHTGHNHVIPSVLISRASM